MAAYVKYEPFAENLAEKVFNLGSDALTVALTNDASITATRGQLSQLTPISYTGLSTRALTTTSSAQTSGTYKLVIADLVLTASGTIPTFQSVHIYDDTATNDELVCGFVDTVARTLVSGDTYTLDFDGSAGLLQWA